MILKMSLAALLMCALTAILWVLENKTAFGRWRPGLRRLLVGLVFGGAAIVSTHYGIAYDNMILNVRDIAPIAAGLLFDPWAGVIAGLIGGVERYIAGQVLFIGAYSRIACGISTALAGLFAAVCRKYLFESKKPTPFYAFAVGALMEVFHMLMVLLTHMDDMKAAFDVVRVCAVPMILFTAIGLLLATVIVSALAGRRLPRLKRPDRAETPITNRFQAYLLLFVTAMMVCTFTFTYVAQTRLTLENARSLLTLNAEDIEKRIGERESNLKQATELIKHQALIATHAVAQDIAADGGLEAATRVKLNAIADLYDIYEINVVNSEGIITASTHPGYVGFDMTKQGQSKEFMGLTDGSMTELVQDFQPISYDGSISIMYAGVALPGGFVQTGYNDDAIARFESLADVSAIVADQHIGEAGFALLADETGSIVSQYEGFTDEKTFEALGIAADQPEGFFFSTIEGQEYYCYLTQLSGYRAMLIMNAAELYQNRDVFAYETALMEILVFAAIFGLIFVLVRRIIIRNLERVNASLARITSGNLNEVVSVRDSAEFSSLSEDINHTVATLKRYIEEAENRINAELEFAKEIQISALPGVFPPFPEKKEFALYAAMRTAKEVGGDFYDFFFVSENHLALVMADVSGKGIPAALFMMKSKTLIKSLAESGLPPETVLSIANEKLCEGNDAQMFVTAWLGILDIRTGLINCANAGHEYPALCRAGGSYELYHDKHGFVLGGMENVRYRAYTLELHPGDKLFVYTDGVTEATDAQKQLFGTDRLLDALNSLADATPEGAIGGVQDAIDRFVGEAPQFDDITMLALSLRPADEPAVLTMAPAADAAARATAFSERYFSERGVPHKILMKLNIAVDEIVTNIAAYSGATVFTVRCLVSNGRARICFSDNGAAYDPLSRPDPDVTLDAEERGVGGLGIFMVKEFMDDMTYAYLDGNNVLTVEKAIE